MFKVDDQVVSALLNNAFQLLLLVLTGLLIPWVKSKVGASKFEKAALFISSAVKAAEQIYGDGKGSTKLEYVVNVLKSKGIKIDDTVMQQIEAAVFSETKKHIATLPASTEVVVKEEGSDTSEVLNS